MRQTFDEKLTEIIRPEVEALGCTLWGLTAPSKTTKRIVRIYIESPDGVSIDQCAKVSRQVGLLLEVEDIIPGAFTLEVSSPGLDRRFFSTDQLRDYVGKKLTALAYDAVDGRRKFAGTLKDVANNRFTLTEETGDVTLVWTDLKEVRLVHEF